MEIHFKDNKIRRLCNDEAYARQKFQPKIVQGLKILVSKLSLYQKFDVFCSTDFLRQKYRPEELQGDKIGLKSLRIDHSYRMTLTVAVEENENGEDIITILEVSNHYGD